MPQLTAFSKVTSESQRIKQPVIVQILPALNLGGVERGTIEMARAIIDAGGKAVIISSGGQLVPQLQRIGAIHISLPVHVKNPLKWGRIRRQLRGHLKEQGADIVHVRSRAPAWIALPVAKRLGIETISTIHGKFKAQNIFKKIYNAKILSAKKLIAISEHVKNGILDKHNNIDGLTDKMTVIHRGVDIDYFNPANVTQARIIKQAQILGLPDDRPVIMLPARPTAWKGHQILLDAVAKMGRQDITVVLQGIAHDYSKFYEAMQRHVARLSIESLVRFAEKTNDMPASLMLADVVVMPSIEPEPFGRVAVEAQAMGRLIVAFAHGGAVESIIDRKTGYLAEPNDVDSLVNALEEALSLGPRQRRKWAEVARDHVKNNFTTKNMCDATLAQYDSLLSNR